MPKTILVVEDRAVDREYLTMLLRYAGHRVVEAADGNEALALVSGERPDLVISDVLMPGMDGFELVRALRAMPEVAGTHVMFYTATYDDAEANALARAGGVTTLLHKPAEPEALLAAVAAALGAAAPSASPAAYDREHLRLVSGKLYEKSEDLETANRRLAALVALGQQLAATREVPQLLECFRRGACQVLGARRLVVGLLDEAGHRLAHVVGDETGPWLVQAAVETARERRQRRWEVGGEAWDCVPVATADQALGCVCFSGLEGRQSTQDEELAGMLASQLAVAFENARHHERVERQAEALREADRRKDEFLAMLAHELRNPLAPIRSAVELLSWLESGDAQAEWAREVIGRQVDHMVRLVDDLLDVSRITRGKITIRKAPLDLRDVVRHTLESTRARVDARRHTLQVSMPGEAVPVEGDPARLEQVFANLVHNAVKFMDEGGRIEVTLARGGDAAEVRVRDHGQGVARDHLQRIFEPFFQDDQGLARTQGGLGIGLTMARRLVALHGGTIEAASEGPGRGCELVVRLPLSAAAAPAERAPEPAPRPSARRILVVDDNVDAAEAVSLLLRVAGHEVVEAHGGPEALAALDAFDAEVVLLDIGLPGMSGFEVARRIRQHPRARAVKIVALTGYGRDEDRRQAALAGIDRHLVKPVGASTLSKVISDLFDA